MIAQVAPQRLTTVVSRIPPLWRCEICERSWHWATQPAECGFCAAADDRDAAAEVAALADIEAVSPGAIDEEEREALHDQARQLVQDGYAPVRMVGGLASFRDGHNKTGNWNRTRRRGARHG